MNTTTTQVPVTATGNSCHETGQGIRGWVARRRSLVIVGAVVAATIAFALSQHWLAAASLVQLLFVLPCAIMMFMCMKGSHGKREGGPDTVTRDETPNTTNIPN
jgi:hypothetical protein